MEEIVTIEEVYEKVTSYNDGKAEDEQTVMTVGVDVEGKNYAMVTVDGTTYKAYLVKE